MYFRNIFNIETRKGESMEDQFNLSGKGAVVTGGISGLGKGMVDGLREAGAEVAIIDVSPNVFSIADEIGKQGPKVYGIQGDLGDRSDLERAFNEAVEKLGGRLDIIINNAGIQRRSKCEDFPIEYWDDMLEVNLTSVFLLCQLAGRIMLKQGKGKIINMASMLSFFGGYTVPAYAATKGGVAQLTKALSNEWAGKGINVNAIAPGYMDTNLNTALVNNPNRNKEILARIPAARWGVPDDLKGIAVFLASDASNYISGAIIPIDGGYLGK